MYPFTITRPSRISIIFATVLWALTNAGTVIAQNGAPRPGNMQDQQRDVQGQNQPNEGDQSKRPAQPGLSKEDSSMIRSMAKTNIAEIQLSGLAQAVSEDRVVREFAQRMLDDHGKALAELKEIAAAKGVIIPGGPDEEDVAAARQLALLKGDDFNRRYLSHAGTQAHEKSMQLHQNVGERAQDNALKTYAVKTVTTINRHLKLAQQAQQSYTALRPQGK